MNTHWTMIFPTDYTIHQYTSTFRSLRSITSYFYKIHKLNKTHRLPWCSNAVQRTEGLVYWRTCWPIKMPTYLIAINQVFSFLFCIIQSLASIVIDDLKSSYNKNITQLTVKISYWNTSANMISKNKYTTWKINASINTCISNNRTW